MENRQRDGFFGSLFRMFKSIHLELHNVVYIVILTVFSFISYESNALLCSLSMRKEFEFGLSEKFVGFARLDKLQVIISITVLAGP
jgi:hypothetical protein